MNDPIPSLEEVKTITLEILISEHFSKYFSMRQLRDEVVIKKYDIPLRELQHEERFKTIRLRIGKQIVYLFREFRDKNYIQKHSNRFWIINKEKIRSDLNEKKETI